MHKKKKKKRMSNIESTLASRIRAAFSNHNAKFTPIHLVSFADWVPHLHNKQWGLSLTESKTTLDKLAIKWLAINSLQIVVNIHIYESRIYFDQIEAPQIWSFHEFYQLIKFGAATGLNWTTYHNRKRSKLYAYV